MAIVIEGPQIHPQGRFRGKISNVRELSGDKPAIIFDIETEVGSVSIFCNYNGSLIPNSMLDWVLEKLCGQNYGTIDVETLVGVNVIVSIKHKIADDGRTYANVSQLSVLPKTRFSRSTSEPNSRVRRFSHTSKPDTETDIDEEDLFEDPDFEDDVASADELDDEYLDEEYADA